MALTPAEVAARNAGYSMPEGTHYIREGDDAIRRNAVRAHEDIAEASWWKPVLTSSAQLDSLSDPGLYPMEFARTASELGIPVSATEQGFLEVSWQGTQNNVTQTFYGHTTPGETWQRKSVATVWGDWYRAPIVESHRLDANADLDTLTDAGWYIFTATSVPAQLGIPVPDSGVAALGVLEVRSVYTNMNYITHRYRLFTGGVISRTRNIGVWSEWAEEIASSTDLGARHAMLKDDFTRRYGTVTTGGRAAIALRFDHGLTNFKSVILPLLRARGLTATIAMNARTWGETENAGATPAEADSWSDIEFANHSATHTDAPTYEQQVDEIVNGREELAAQLPNHRIDGWIVPGVGGTQYGGLGTGTRAAAFASSPAGQLILGHHAWSSGHIAGTKYRRLDGVVRSGEEHYTIEDRTVTAINNEIDAAISQSAGLSLMMHPRVLDTPGYITTAQLTEVLDYIAQRRDAGDLVVLTLSEMAVADNTVVFDPATLAALLVDTGWRDITGTLATAPTSGILLVRRTGRTVFVQAHELTFAASASFVGFSALPPGWRPPRTTDMAAARRWASDSGGSLRVNASGAGYVHQVNADAAINGIGSYLTENPAPTTMPGPSA